jgi:anhydro-N-acetylmuramic acid kinase
MVYKVIGLMSGSSLDGLDIAYVHLQERAATVRETTGRPAAREWEFQLVHTECYSYPAEWRERLAAAARLAAPDYHLLHTEYGHYLGGQVLRFIEAHGLEYQVQLIASHGHTALHWPARRMTAQLGDGAAIAAVTRINVVSDLRAMDIALGGQGAPIVPIGEQLLLPGYGLFLNLGGIANISAHGAGAGGGAGAGVAGGAAGGFVAYDVCPANRVLNELAGDEGLAYDKDGALAAGGRVDEALLRQLNALPYYSMGYPKSLANEFGLETELPLLRAGGLSTADALRTYTEHIAEQVERAVRELKVAAGGGPGAEGAGGLVRMLVTGGGAHNGFLTARVGQRLASLGAELVVPDTALVDFKEALVMALIGVLRWREENNVLASVTGASRDSIGGAVWIGQEA